MKRLCLIALAFFFLPASSDPTIARGAAAQENQNTNAQAKTSASEMPKRHRRHRRRHLRHAVVSKTRSGVTKTKEVGETTATKSKEVGEKTVTKSKQVGEKTVTKSKSVGSAVVDKSKTVTQKTKTTGEKVVDKSKKVVKPQ